MNNNETSSWISIFGSLIGLIALVWAGVNEKYPSGMKGAIAAVVEPDRVTQQKTLVKPATIPQTPVRIAPPEFSLEIDGEKAIASATLPKGTNDSQVWSVLSKYFTEPKFSYNLEFTDSKEPQSWLDNLPGVLDKLLAGNQESSLGLKINMDSVEISGEVNSQSRKQEILSDVSLLGIDGRSVVDRLNIITVALNPPSLQAVAIGNLLELSGQIPEKYRNSDFTENLKLAMGAGFVDDAIEYTDNVADSEVLINLGQNLESIGEYGDNPAVYLAEGELKVSIESGSPETSQNLATHLKALIQDTPITVDQIPAPGVVQEVTVTAVDAATPAMKPAPMLGQNVEISQTPRLLEVNFAYNSFELLPGSLDVLDRLVVRLSSSPDLDLVIEGHTDSTGNPDANLYLSQMRADSVKNYLIDSGIEESRLQSIGLGDVRPIASNGTRTGRSKNRRIEIRKGRS